MIELVLAERCTGCGKCIEVCPNDVFDGYQGDTPVVARRADCHTCFLCELYCAVDALYVSPLGDRETGLSEASILESGFLGHFARANGWRAGRPIREAGKVAGPSGAATSPTAGGRA